MNIGKAKLGTGKGKINYKGKLDENNLPFGYGTGIRNNKYAMYNQYFSGHWLGGKFHGICKSFHGLMFGFEPN